MRLDDLDPSSNASDIGTSGGGFGGMGGGGGGFGGLLFSLLPMLLGRRMGCGTILILGAIAFFLFGPGMSLFSGGPAIDGTRPAASGSATYDTAEEQFAGRVLASTEQTWSTLLNGYRPAKMAFYSGTNMSGCGAAQAQMGPFYCPADQTIYLDTSFFDELKSKFGAAGDFAQAYVIAHEVGHHIQTLDGTANEVRNAQARASQAQGNALQVRMELQADCYAGVWAARNANRLEPGDVEEGLRAAHAIGDDTLMRNAGQRPVESMFTHGTSEQRMAWLRRGLQSGDPRQCNAFSADY